MTGSILIPRDEQIAKLADSYREEGYEIVVAPGPADIPFDLGNYPVDLMARKNHRGVLVQVKSRADRLSFEGLQAAVAEVRRHPGWRFVLATAQDIPDIGLPGESDKESTWEEIESRVSRARRLFDAGEHEAAFLAAWIAFEQLLRLQAERVSLPVERLVSTFAIRQLYSLGELSAQQYELGLECQKVRNRVVHGLSCPQLETISEQLLSLVRELLVAWSATAEAV